MAATINGWYRGTKRYYDETNIEPKRTQMLLERGFDLTLHTIEAEPREVLTNHSVGAATRGGVLEKALHETRNKLLPQIEAELTSEFDPTWEERFADLVTQTCQVVRDHGATLTS